MVLVIGSGGVCCLYLTGLYFIEKNIYQVKNIVEKPGPKNAPSLLGSLGGYVLTPDIFKELHKIKPGKNKEVWLVDAINSLRQKRPLYACLVKGKYYDVGSKIGWLKANIELGLKHPATAKNLKNYLKNLTN